VNFSTPAVTGATYTWDFDDGAGSGRTPSHTYQSPGTYHVILTVKRAGQTATDAKDIHVPC
jgi:PKD repeat protein